ncbi:hypothetical protein SAMN05519103_03908 [Rhizobiales bacterium GAS113]|jgi:hypothetical protein|nr:hypothetical protein SAMN05519103_03908 [Rhizobiales bacterium GAS113]
MIAGLRIGLALMTRTQTLLAGRRSEPYNGS